MPISPSGAYYLAGYAAECALKACFIRARNDEFPDRQSRDRENDPYTHDLKRLLRLARLETPLNLARDIDTALSTNWNAVVLWTEESRYALNTSLGAQGLIDALEDPDHGVLQWLRTYW